MPSKTKKQSDFMKACAHGFKPSKTTCPPMKVAMEYMHADQKKSMKKKVKF